MKFLFIFLGFFFIPLLQGSFFNMIISPSFFSPNIAICISLIWILLRGFNDSVLWILLLGVVYDSILSSSFGLMALFLLLSGYIFSLFARQVLFNEKFIGKVVISLYVLISLFSYYTMVYLSKTFSSFDIFSFIRETISYGYSSFFGAVYSLILFWLFYKMVRNFGNRQESMTIKR